MTTVVGMCWPAAVGSCMITLRSTLPRHVIVIMVRRTLGAMALRSVRPGAAVRVIVTVHF
jgi:hypothetical protein